MRKYEVKLDPDTFGYHQAVVDAERMGISDSGDLLFYTDDKGINRVAFTIAGDLWYSCNEIDAKGNSLLNITFSEPAEDEPLEETDSEE